MNIAYFVVSAAVVFVFFFKIRTIYNQYDVHRNRIAPGCVRNLTGSKKNKREISVIFKVG